MLVLVLPILGQYYLLHWSHFSHYASKLAFTKISDCIYRVFRVIATSNSSMILLYFHFHLIHIFPFSVFTLFISLTHFHFCQPITSFYHWFLLIPHELITMRQRVSTTMGFAIWITDLEWPAIGRLWKKWHDWSLIMLCMCYLHDLWTEKLIVKLIL